MPKKWDQQDFLKRAAEVHGDKYDYSKALYVNSNTPVVIICREHGSFTQKPSNHINQHQGCNECGQLKARESHRLTHKEVIERFTKAHGDRYEYSRVEFVNVKTKVIIKCRIHGEFSQLPPDHWMGRGCVKCMGMKAGDLKRKTISTFIEEATRLHNGKYDYSRFIYKNAITKGLILCPLHGEFLQSPNTHLARGGSGCPACGDIKSGLYGLTAFRRNREFADEYNELYFVTVCGFVKIGISKDSSRRSSSGSVRFEEYLYVRGTTRACAWCVEQHVLQQTHWAALSGFPTELQNWPGRHEIRENILDKDETIEILDQLLDECEKIGWESFATKYGLADYGYSWEDPND